MNLKKSLTAGIVEDGIARGGGDAVTRPRGVKQGFRKAPQGAAPEPARASGIEQALFSAGKFQLHCIPGRI
ncbi:MAG: hypothetical protein KGN84_17280 [Acidobacteriota bacterium]|nr:hypothetical protein [Acidobacteriota bacterium]